MKLLAIIPARKNSKGIPDKNMALVGGKPLITWAVECAVKAPSIERVIVTTDSEEIACIAEVSGAEVPFIRPVELARDDTPGIDPILHAIMWIQNREDLTPTHVVVLQPTSPLRATEDVENAYALLLEKDADAVVSVVAADKHPCWMKVLNEEGRMESFLPGNDIPFRRQDLPDVYVLNGAIYMAKTEFLLRQRDWYAEHTFGYVMPIERSLDIDTQWDFELANNLLLGRS